ncbi:sigma-70 family RNA polymerase sigma factor [Bacillus suaedaesalsae]|uniref:Sigma-70 family RNA polymerase sigma factor n=1 Tax=Bacillus suaedaesalsae TaxID=2810349 RepID=A0ABS2DIN9_9BACI|nr:sigma-70 family RNA polymerase sigma factor [Bacillus suaedaesalsae]MBM6618256.1 sigma-70 family RNA polymerase sigma factor [Bacillus suaedaesalsae]
MTLYAEKVYLLAYSFVKDKGLAEDIAQEVFIKCYRHLDKFRGDAEIKSWIYRIAVNTAKDFVRRKKYKILYFQKEALEHLIRSETLEDTYVERSENNQLLQKVLSLKPKYREVIILHYFHDLKITEISEALGVNSNTVKTRLKRGKLALSEMLKNEKEAF